jgi:hypothetical protein
MGGLVGLWVYIIAFFAVGWFDYWWFVGFVFLSPLIATVLAFRDIEFWPVVHPQYGFFWLFPAIFISYGLLLNHPREWGQWLGWSLLIAVVITAAWTLKWRRDIDREWAVFGTLAVVFVFVAFGLHVANSSIAGQQRTSELATIVTSSPGGYRRPSEMVLSTHSREREVFFPGLRRYFDFGPDDAVCVRRYSGGLGWEWAIVAPCTDEEIEEAISS